MKSTAKKIIQLTLSLALAGLFGVTLLAGIGQNVAPVYAQTDTCFATIDGATVYSSADAGAVQQAINAATAGDVIKIAGTCAGVTPTAGLTQTAYISKNLTLQGGYTPTNWLATSDPDTYPTVLDAQNNGRVVYIPDGVEATLAGLTIQNGFTGDDGGGIYSLGVLTLTNSLLTHNAGKSGGGLYGGLTGRTLVDNSQIISNTASILYGGGIFAAHPITITQSLISQNIADSYGGGIIFDNSPHFLIQHSAIISNTSNLDGGGGAYIYVSIGAIQHSRVVSNTSESGGGGIYLDSSSTAATVQATEIAYNQSDFEGGGIMVYGGSDLLLADSNVHHNTSTTGVGGGVYLEQSVITVTGSAITHNFAGDSTRGGGGLFSDTAASVYLQNSTISHNEAQNGGVSTGSVAPLS